MQPKRGQTRWALTPGEEAPRGGRLSPRDSKPFLPLTAGSTALPSQPPDQNQNPVPITPGRVGQVLTDLGLQGDSPLCSEGLAGLSHGTRRRGGGPGSERSLTAPSSLPPRASNTYQGQADCRGSAGGAGAHAQEVGHCDITHCPRGLQAYQAGLVCPLTSPADPHESSAARVRAGLAPSALPTRLTPQCGSPA